MCNNIVNPRSRRTVRFNLCNIYRGIQHTITRLEKAGRTISAYEKGCVEQYTKALAVETDPTLAGLEIGWIYAHLARLDKEAA